MKKSQKLPTSLMVVFSLILGFGLIGCNADTVDSRQGIQSLNLMHGITAQQVDAVTLDEQFLGAAANFSLDLFRAAISNSDNSLISPTSVLLALAMTANGTDGNTLFQMEQVIGGGMSISGLNAYLHTFVRNLTSHPKVLVTIANSIMKEINYESGNMYKIWNT